MENQVVSLELAKKLKEFGFEQKSLFWWDKGDGIEDRIEYSPDKPLLELVSAYTVAELGEMLPMEVLFEDVYFKLAIWKIPKGWSIFYGGENYALKDEVSEKLADAMAKMLIYLKENNLLVNA